MNVPKNVPELEVVRDYRLAKSKKKIIPILGQTYGCGRKKIEAILERHGVYTPKPKVPRTPGKPWSPEEDRRLLQLTQEGLTREELASQFPGRTTGAISTRMTRLGIKKRPTGEQTGRGAKDNKPFLGYQKKEEKASVL